MPSPRFKPRSYVVANVRYRAEHSAWLGTWAVRDGAGRPIGQVRRDGPHTWRTFTPHGTPTGAAWRSLKQGVEYLAYQRPSYAEDRP